MTEQQKKNAVAILNEFSVSLCPRLDMILIYDASSEEVCFLAGELAIPIPEEALEEIVFRVKCLAETRLRAFDDSLSVLRQPQPSQEHSEEAVRLVFLRHFTMGIIRALDEIRGEWNEPKQSDGQGDESTKPV